MYHKSKKDMTLTQYNEQIAKYINEPLVGAEIASNYRMFEFCSTSEIKGLFNTLTGVINNTASVKKSGLITKKMKAEIEATMLYIKQEFKKENLSRAHISSVLFQVKLIADKIN